MAKRYTTTPPLDWDAAWSEVINKEADLNQELLGCKPIISTRKAVLYVNRRKGPGCRAQASIVASQLESEARTAAAAIFSSVPRLLQTKAMAQNKTLILRQRSMQFQEYDSRTLVALGPKHNAILDLLGNIH